MVGNFETFVDFDTTFCRVKIKDDEKVILDIMAVVADPLCETDDPKSICQQALNVIAGWEVKEIIYHDGNTVFASLAQVRV